MAAVVVAILSALFLFVAGMVTDGNRQAAVERLIAANPAARAQDRPSLPPIPATGEDTAAQSVSNGRSDSSVGAWSVMLNNWSAVSEGFEWEDLEKRLSVHSSEWSELDLADAEAFLNRNSDLLEALRRLASKGGPMVEIDPDNIEVSQEHLAETLEHLTETRQLARLLRIDAIVSARLGDHERAVEDIIAGMGVARAQAEEPLLISQLVAIACHGIAFQALVEAFEPGDLPPELATALIDNLGASNGREALAAGLYTEAQYGLGMYAWIRGERESFLGTGPQERGILAHIAASPIGRPFLNMNEGAHIEFYTAMVEAATLPYYEARHRIDEALARVEDLSFLRQYARIFSRNLGPALDRAIEAQARSDAQLDVARIGLAIEQHFQEHGRYPESLDAIAGYLGEVVPLDPFTGEDFIYRPTSTGFGLYSVGQNQIDDGGVHDLRSGDIVWRGEKKRPTKMALKSN